MPSMPVMRTNPPGMRSPWTAAIACTSGLPHSPLHDRTISEHTAFFPRRSSHVFPILPDGRWNADHTAVEFSIGVGEYEGVVRIPRRVFQILLDQSPAPER